MATQTYQATETPTDLVSELSLRSKIQVSTRRVDSMPPSWPFLEFRWRATYLGRDGYLLDSGDHKM